MQKPWVAFTPFIVVSAVHVVAQFFGDDAITTPTKLLLMPALALGVLWARRGERADRTTALLLAAIAFSWLGDEAGLFFPFAPTLPLMLLFFGIAHVLYIVLFLRHLTVRRLSWWIVALALAWWGILVAVLWPHLGALLQAVAVYGILLGGTAVAASRCHPLIAWGGLAFLLSDSLLAFQIFVPDALPGGSGALVMLTYCVGQGLIAAGAVRSTRATSPMTPVARQGANA
jgi:uncharacterized membrane protein YhhN